MIFDFLIGLIQVFNFEENCVHAGHVDLDNTIIC